jgi:pilus assembly protein CpaC
LVFLPIVLGNGKIYLEVEPSVSNLNAAFGFSFGGVTVPGRNVQRVRTSVLMEDGQTFAIGGLIQNTITANDTKTPILGDLPFVGGLFNTVAHSESEQELVVLVTPYLIDPMDCHQSPRKLPGRETRTPDDFELFMEGLLEAPRGQRKVFEGHQYVPAYKNDPNSAMFPCARNGGGHGFGHGNCAVAGGCADGCCDHPTLAPAGVMNAPTFAPAAQPGELPAGVPVTPQ